MYDILYDNVLRVKRAARISRQHFAGADVCLGIDAALAAPAAPPEIRHRPLRSHSHPDGVQCGERGYPAFRRCCMETSLRAAVVLLGALVGAAGAQEPRFAGTWVLDPSEGVLSDARPREVELDITDDGQTVTVTERIRASKKGPTYSCKSDGKPCQESVAGMTYIRVLRREAGALVWQIGMTRLADGAGIKWTERWSLTDEGRTLTLHRAFPGDREYLEVFRRRQP
jgi:hypothetical protein